MAALRPAETIASPIPSGIAVEEKTKDEVDTGVEEGENGFKPIERVDVDDPVETGVKMRMHVVMQVARRRRVRVWMTMKILFIGLPELVYN